MAKSRLAGKELKGLQTDYSKTFFLRERSGSVVECLTRDGGAVGLSLTGALRCVP